MNMNSTFFIRKEDCDPKWHLIDASDQVLGRLATKVANLLRGKGKAEFSPHANCGDYVVIVNCEKVKLTGNKWDDKEYKSYSGYRSGLKTRSAKEMLEKHPTKIIQLAVSRQREYMADAGAVELTREPQGLASSLEKIANDPDPLEAANRGTQHLYIVNPLKKAKTGRRSSLFSTHPDIHQRVARLRAMT